VSSSGPKLKGFWRWTSSPWRRPGSARCTCCSGRLGAAKRAGQLDEELERLRRISLVVVDEIGYIPFDPQAAALFFELVSSRYERASMIVSSNKTFSSWAEIFGDQVAVAAMVDRLVHHAEVIVLKGDSCRLKGRSKEVMAAAEGS
jgi:DNA replication protein DnaC